MRQIVCLLAMAFIHILLGPGMVYSDENENIAGKAIENGMNKEKAEEVRRLIDAELHFGTDSQEIEAFFERHGITYSYDRFQHRYQAIIRDVSPALDQAVVIYIYIDEAGCFKHFEVHNSFTTP